MAKKRKIKKLKIPEKKSKKPIFWLVGAVSVVVVVLIVSGNFLFSGVDRDTGDTEAKKGKSFHVKGGETRPVLDPAMFTGMVHAAYAAAKKYPEVMDQVHCYCYCDEPPFYHKSLLSCFTENHGAG